MCAIWSGIPPTALATTGLPFQSASLTVSPNPSRRDFWMMTVEARWSALTSRWLVGGSSRMRMSGSSCARVRTSADEQEPAVHRPADQAERLDHADGVFQPVEAGDLRDQRLVLRDLQPMEDRLDRLGGQLAVLVAERVNGRGDQELADRQPLGELRG